MERVADDVQRIVETTPHRLVRLLQKRGLLDEAYDYGQNMIQIRFVRRITFLYTNDYIFYQASRLLLNKKGMTVMLRTMIAFTMTLLTTCAVQASDWAPNSESTIGSGWHGRQVFAGDGHVLYIVQDDGDLVWYRHAGDGRESWVDRSGSVIGSGWDMFSQVFASDAGSIYGITPEGKLHWYRYLGDGEDNWHDDSFNVIGSGWDMFSRVFAGDAGSIYGITPEGKLHWYRYLGDGEDNWADGSAEIIGAGWDIFSHVTAGSRGRIYAVESDGALKFYRNTTWKRPVLTKVTALDDLRDFSHKIILRSPTNRFLALGDDGGWGFVGERADDAVVFGLDYAYNNATVESPVRHELKDRFDEDHFALFNMRVIGGGGVRVDHSSADESFKPFTAEIDNPNASSGGAELLFADQGNERFEIYLYGKMFISEKFRQVLSGTDTFCAQRIMRAGGDAAHYFEIFIVD